MRTKTFKHISLKHIIIKFVEILTAFRPKRRQLTRDNCSNFFFIINQLGLNSKKQQQKANKCNYATKKLFSKAWTVKKLVKLKTL